MLLPIQVGLHHDVDFIVSGPVPVKSAFPKSSDVCNMEAHVLLCVPCLLGRCAVKWWIVVWGFGRWQSPGDLSWLDQCCGLYSPNLNYLAGKLWCQKWKHLGSGSIICNPHEVLVHEDGVVVPCLMGGSSVADVRHWNVLCTGSGEPIKGARDGVWSMWVEGSFVFCHGAVDGDSAVDVTDVDHFVVPEVLAIALVGPAVHEFLPGDFIEELIRVVHNERDLDVLCDVATLLDLSASILENAGLGVDPQGMHKMCSVSFDVQVVFLPQLVQAWQLLDVNWFGELQGGLDGILDNSPWIAVEFRQIGTHPAEGTPWCIGVAAGTGISDHHAQILE